MLISLQQEIGHLNAMSIIENKGSIDKLETIIENSHAILNGEDIEMRL